jgi:hypothetical protein
MVGVEERENGMLRAYSKAKRLRIQVEVPVETIPNKEGARA